MDSRRDFIKKIALLSGAGGVLSSLPPSIQRALAINPLPGTTYLDAEHIVILMQENRSFDHCFGTLQGVRGFNDPRAISLPGKNKVWLQANKAGETYAPFRLDIKDTKITWMGSLPHGRESQMHARNDGKYDQWLEAKKSGEEAYSHMPLTMGYYTREDIPFYYALADAFTVCDQNFCSSLTGTDPNRLYFWTGNVRESQHEQARPYVQNEDVERGVEWETFPELLEQNGISWKVYQNEVAADGGFTEEEDQWLSNFGDNPLEYFHQFHIKLSKRFIDHLPKKIAKLKTGIAALESEKVSLTEGSKELAALEKKLKRAKANLTIALEDEEKWTAERFDKLSQHQKNIHQKAFTTNTKDPFQHQLTPLDYTDGNTGRKINIPKGDILNQFREDVQSGNLPTVSWLAAPENFSDHPSAPWFGSWYLSETMDILTKDPEVWKKTIFILAYDENDGYFDHVPPFVAPDPRNPATGAVSTGINTGVEHVTLAQDSPGSIGLGYRVPLVIASPWTRGGWVNSQVFDHTSTLQFLEGFLSKKFGKPIEQKNISKWRRTVCGDLTSVFRPGKQEKTNELPFLAKDIFIESIYNAKFKNVPAAYKLLTKEDMAEINQDPHSSPHMPLQEKGTRSSCTLPYQLYAEGKLDHAKKTFFVKLEAAKDTFGNKSAGSPFNIYAPGKYMQDEARLWSYAVAAGDSLTGGWNIHDFEDERYHLCVYGPNGFFREFKGDINDPAVDITCDYEFSKTDNKNLTGNIHLKIVNAGNSRTCIVEIKDNAYKSGDHTISLGAAGSNTGRSTHIIDLSKSFGWYDFTVKIKGETVFEKRYAGRVETGKHGITDPVMGRVV